VRDKRDGVFIGVSCKSNIMSAETFATCVKRFTSPCVGDSLVDPRRLEAIEATLRGWMLGCGFG